MFRLLDELGYTDWLGCEYRPRGETMHGLGWLYDELRMTKGDGWDFKFDS